MTNVQLPITKMTIQQLIDLLMSAEDKDLPALIQPCANCERHEIDCVDTDDSGEFILYMKEKEILL